MTSDMPRPMPGDRERDVAAVVSAWHLGRDVAQFRFLDATEDQLDDASARRVLDDLIADGWQRPGCSDAAAMRALLRAMAYDGIKVQWDTEGPYLRGTAQHPVDSKHQALFDRVISGGK
jgi:hypothetical protein